MTATASGTEDISENRIELGGGLRCVPVPPRRSITMGKHLAFTWSFHQWVLKVWMQTSRTLSDPLLLPHLHSSLLLVLGSIPIITLGLKRSINRARPSRSTLGRFPAS